MHQVSLQWHKWLFAAALPHEILLEAARALQHMQAAHLPLSFSANATCP